MTPYGGQQRCKQIIDKPGLTGCYVTKVVIIANSELPSLELCVDLIEKSDFVIACDGGLSHCINNNFDIDFLVGDLDSVSKQELEVIEQQNVEIIKLEEQQTNDLSKAIEYSKKFNVSRIDIVGVDGGDYAHQMANYFALLEHEVDAYLHLKDYVVTTITKSKPFSSSIDSAMGFSLFSIGESEGVNITGAKWELKDKKLSSSSLGLHNESSGNIVNIDCKSGNLIIFISR